MYRQPFGLLEAELRLRISTFPQEATESVFLGMYPFSITTIMPSLSPMESAFVFMCPVRFAHRQSSLIRQPLNTQYNQMAIKSTGQFILCDGEGCTSKVSLPVALRPVLSGKSTVDQLQGWLFVTVSGQRRHYCPNCVPKYFSDITSFDESKN